MLCTFTWTVFCLLYTTANIKELKCFEYHATAPRTNTAIYTCRLDSMTKISMSMNMCTPKPSYTRNFLLERCRSDTLTTHWSLSQTLCELSLQKSHRSSRGGWRKQRKIIAVISSRNQLKKWNKPNGMNRSNTKMLPKNLPHKDISLTKEKTQEKYKIPAYSIRTAAH